MAKLDQVRRTHGSHMAMRLATEKENFSRLRRLPGLESSNVALQTLMGESESVDFPDFMNSKIANVTCFCCIVFFSSENYFIIIIIIIMF